MRSGGTAICCKCVAVCCSVLRVGAAPAKMEVDGGRAVSREVFLPSKANDVKSFIFMAQRVVRCLHVRPPVPGRILARSQFRVSI